MRWPLHNPTPPRHAIWADTAEGFAAERQLPSGAELWLAVPWGWVGRAPLLRDCYEGTVRQPCAPPQALFISIFICLAENSRMRSLRVLRSMSCSRTAADSTSSRAWFRRLFGGFPKRGVAA
eukprot:TRINITY_DN8762_c0_g1_i1.p1 TRINITY_DN8762_c0_g1~~TRINITY_DN8762_c0_g1_i1.p1  ORF type:complete len:122 (-),score=6.84 TRINITY_DN8762_c0_g1_i1:21-386(-)